MRMILALSEVYRCPRCSQTAIEDAWDESTLIYLKDRERRGLGGYSFATIHEVQQFGSDGQAVRFHCPYCNEASPLKTLTKQRKRAIKREHFDENIGLFEL